MPLTFTSISLLLAVFVPCRIGTRLCIAEFSNESVMTMTHPSRLLSEITSENVALVSAVATFVLMTFASLVFRKQDVSSLGENVQLGKSGRSTHPIRHSLSPFLFNGSVRNFTCLLSSNPMLEANQARAGLGLDVSVKSSSHHWPTSHLSIVFSSSHTIENLPSVGQQISTARPCGWVLELLAFVPVP